MKRFIELRLRAATTLLLACLPQLSFAQAVAPGTAMPGIAQVRERDQASLLHPTPAPLFFASTDPRHKNADYITLKPREIRRVALAPGTLARLWSTALEPDKISLDLNEIPVSRSAEVTWPLLDNGKAKLGTYENKTYLWYPAEESSTRKLLRPGTALMVRNNSDKPNKWFYQVAVRPVVARSALELYKQQRVGAPTTVNGDGKIEIKAGRDAVVTQLQVNMKAKPDTAALNAIHLKITAQPRQGGAAGLILVDVPLGPLVGAFRKAAPLQDAMTEWNEQKLVLHWPMPFDGAKETLQIEVLGASASLKASVGEMAAGTDLRFHAAYGSARTVKEQRVPLLGVKGGGVFGGVRLEIAPAQDSRRRTFAYLEGNEKLIADGKTHEGTGTEDFFNSAWYFPHTTFARPYGGLTERDEQPPRVAMYRLMVPDALPFNRDFLFDFEVGNGNNADDLEFRWVAFWYARDGAAAEIRDALSGTGSPGRGASGATGVGAEGQIAPELPVWVELVVGFVLLGAVWLSLTAVFRRKK